jgi:CHAT domain-containing protein
MRLGNHILKSIGYLESLPVYLVAHEHVIDTSNLDNLAWFVENEIFNGYTRLGDYEKADYFANLTERSLKHFGEINYLSRLYANRGIKEKSIGNIDGAISYFQRGYRMADSIDYPLGLFGNAVNLADIYNEFPSKGLAEPYLAKAESLLPGIEKDSRIKEKKSFLLEEIAEYKLKQGKCGESIPLFKKSIELLTEFYSSKFRRDFSKLYYSLGQAYYQCDSLILAMEAIHNGLHSLIPELRPDQLQPDESQLYAENSFFELLGLQSRVFEKQYDLTGDPGLIKSSLSALLLALKANDMLRSVYIADPSKLISIRSNKELVERAIMVSYRLYAEDPSVKNFNTARALFNRSKSLLYGEKSRRNALIPLITEEDRVKYGTLQARLFEWHNKKHEPNADINYINGRILAAEEEIDQIFESYDESVLKTKIPSGYIEYFIAEEDVFAISSMDGKDKFVKLGPRAHWNELISRLNEYIDLKGDSFDETITSEVYDFLVAPVISKLPPALVIISDASIGLVPFDMLTLKNGDLLIRHTDIAYNFEYVTYEIVSDPADKSWDVYCLAPQYKKKELKVNENIRGSIYHLPYAKLEMDSIQRLFGESALTSQSQDKILWKEHINNTRIFHYAGHAIIDGEKSFLALNDSDDEMQQITAREISLHYHPLELAVLSACETGLGKMEQGEGIRSLGRSFMESGTQATVISLWNVNDRSTASIMTRFYQYLLKGTGKSEALRQSKLDFIAGNPSHRHPYYWAAFIPAGDMRPLKKFSE